MKFRKHLIKNNLAKIQNGKNCLSKNVNVDKNLLNNYDK